MRHVKKALLKFQAQTNQIGDIPEFITIENENDLKGVPPIVSFTIQSDPIGEVGINGCQAVDMLLYIKCLFESLNEDFPCTENSVTINKIREAIHWQGERTKDRKKRGVEGENKK